MGMPWSIAGALPWLKLIWSSFIGHALDQTWQNWVLKFKWHTLMAKILRQKNSGGWVRLWKFVGGWS